MSIEKVKFLTRFTESSVQSPCRVDGLAAV
jgi:hypothetical protein